MPYLQLIENGECSGDTKSLPGRMNNLKIYSLRMDYINIKIYEIFALYEL